MNVWIINHYAIPPSLGGVNRHYYFKKYLNKMGHSVRIFAASQIHNSNVNMITGNKLFDEQIVDGVEYTYVRTSPYKGNGFFRIKNMLQFPIRIWRVCKRFGKPDVIYTSSPSPFTAASALLMAKKMKIPCVVEIRDLWPESIVAYKGVSKNNPAIQALYCLEKWIYKKADRLIFTMEGGADYIREKGWDKLIDMSKIHHINNGVDLEEFDYNASNFKLDDLDLLNRETFKIVYTGSIRLVNNLKMIVDAAAIVNKTLPNKIHFLIYGDGDQLDSLRNYVKDNALENICFKGRVDKKYIPFILRNADTSLMHNENTMISKFGFSLNKQFDYFAAGKPVLSDLACNYNLIEKYDCGIVIASQSPQVIADAVIRMSSLPEEDYRRYCDNARRAANDYNYKALANKMLSILEGVIRH